VGQKQLDTNVATQSGFVTANADIKPIIELFESILKNPVVPDPADTQAPEDTPPDTESK
jgi:hypothetical protein